jgi:sarcosine oxidase delta subunit|tara:strand:- start:9406 stop:9606 length:201 start_codon:yes stop_codon:yes gene_type:complete
MAGSKPAKPGKLATGDEEVEPLKIQNLGDMAQIKRVLDETAVAVREWHGFFFTRSQHRERRGYAQP